MSLLLFYIIQIQAVFDSPLYAVWRVWRRFLYLFVPFLVSLTLFSFNWRLWRFAAVSFAASLSRSRAPSQHQRRCIHNNCLISRLFHHFKLKKRAPPTCEAPKTAYLSKPEISFRSSPSKIPEFSSFPTSSHHIPPIPTFVIYLVPLQWADSSRSIGKNRRSRASSSQTSFFIQISPLFFLGAFSLRPCPS